MLPSKLRSLKNAFDKNLEMVSRQVADFPWTDEVSYTHWLGQTYYFVSHTPVFLAVMAGKYGLESPEDQRRVLSHLREEAGHEKFALQDLRAFQLGIEDIEEFVETSVFYQSQYYWIDRFGPLSHAGYSLFLEGLASNFGKRTISLIEAAFGKGKASFLSIHANEDARHYIQGIEWLAKSTDAELKPVLRNLNQTALLYSRLLDAVVTKSQLKQKAA